MTPLTFYNSRSIILFIYFFLPTASLLPPYDPAILTHSAGRDRSVDTECVESDTAELAGVSHTDGTDQSGRR